MSDLTNVSAVSLSERGTSDGFAAVLSHSGSVTVLPPYQWDLINNTPRDLTNVIAIDAGDWHVLALRNDGTVAAWGDWAPNDTLRNKGQADVPPGLSNVVAVAAISSASYALRADGTVVAWGTNASLPGDLPVVTQIAGYGDTRVAIVRPGQVAAPPVFLLHPSPSAIAVEVRGSAMFRTQAAGFPPLSYQWYHDLTAISGATNTILSLVNLDATQSGIYKIAVSNPGGTTWSEPATLSVLPVLEVNLVPAISLKGTVGRDYRVEWISRFNSTAGWLPLDTVTLTNNPQFYFDTSAIGQPSRLYRSVELPQ